MSQSQKSTPCDSPIKFVHGDCRGALAHEDTTGRIGVVFDMPGGKVIRISISRASAFYLVQSLLRSLGRCNSKPIAERDT